MKNKYLITIILIITLIALCMFQSNSYPIISKGAYSKNYKIEKLSKWTDCDILYDSVNNYFLVCFNKDLIKLDSLGNEVYRTPFNDLYLSCTSHYIFNCNGLIDLSRDTIIFEEFANVLNGDSLEKTELVELFNKLYASASVVTYDDFHNDGFRDNLKAYFKINGSWTLLYIPESNSGLKRRVLKNERGDVIHDRNKMGVITINDIPEKINRLLLLKDSAKGQYSNYSTTEETELYPHYCARFPFPDDYLPCKRVERGYSNIKVEDRSFFNIPIIWRMTVNYKLKMEDEVFKFKCLAYKGNDYILNSSGMYWFRLPTKFKESSGVSFIRVSRRSNSFDESDFTGLYIIKKK